MVGTTTVVSQDASLLEQARLGDQDAYARLWMEARPSAVRFAHLWGAESPEDVAEEAGVRVLAAIRAGKGPSQNFTAYVLSAVRNLVHAKKVYHRDESLNDDRPDLMADNDVEASAIGEMERDRIAAVFAAMKPREVMLLQATAIDGLPLRKAAAMVGLGARTAAMVATRARRDFQRRWIESHVTIGEDQVGECRWALQQLGAYLSRSPDQPWAERMRKHLLRCHSCAETLNEVRCVSRMWGQALGNNAAIFDA